MEVLKSIMSLRPCKFISILELLISIVLFMNSAVADDTYKEIIKDLPVKSDFDLYLRALENVVDFCIRRKYYVDLNLQFGLFLIDMNLKRVLQQSQMRMPLERRFRLKKILDQKNVLADYFYSMVQKMRNNAATSQHIKMARLFYNASLWPRPPDKFNKDMLNQTRIYRPEQLTSLYQSWDKYSNNVINFEKNQPTPIVVDECIGLLVQTSPMYGRSEPSCLTSLYCKQVMQGGNQIGYSLTHRLIYLVITRFSRKCVVFSEKEDKLKMDMFCKKCFNEAEYIAINSFLLPNLMYEQIALCSLFGHVQFMRNFWLKTLLQLQTSEGCFSENIATGTFNANELKEDKNRKWEMQGSADIMNGQCNRHFTAVAAATLSSALRYIIATYY